jgi:phospholipid/cholesterol/gamma-HCH transport system substrate-binding protein
MKTNLLEVGMGAAVLIVCAFFGIFVYSTSQWQTPKGYEVIAKFDRIDGLMRGSDVRLSGVKVGHIKDIHLDPQTYLAVVHITLAPHVSLPTDSSAEIISDGLLGGKIMALVPGGEDQTIPPGGEIKFTQAAVSLESLIGQFIFNAQDKKEESAVEKVSDTVVK